MIRIGGDRVDQDLTKSKEDNGGLVLGWME